jgi:hypothetical protein
MMAVGLRGGGSTLGDRPEGNSSKSEGNFPGENSDVPSRTAVPQENEGENQEGNRVIGRNHAPSATHTGHFVHSGHFVTRDRMTGDPGQFGLEKILRIELASTRFLVLTLTFSFYESSPSSPPDPRNPAQTSKTYEVALRAIANLKRQFLDKLPQPQGLQ